MATAEVIMKTDYVLSLKLSKREARTMRLLLSRVGGKPEDTAREYSNEVHRVLVEAMRDVDEYFHSYGTPESDGAASGGIMLSPQSKTLVDA